MHLLFMRWHGSGFGPANANLWWNIVSEAHLPVFMAFIKLKLKHSSSLEGVWVLATCFYCWMKPADYGYRSWRHPAPRIHLSSVYVLHLLSQSLGVHVMYCMMHVSAQRLIVEGTQTMSEKFPRHRLLIKTSNRTKKNAMPLWHSQFDTNLVNKLVDKLLKNKKYELSNWNLASWHCADVLVINMHNLVLHLVTICTTVDNNTTPLYNTAKDHT